MKEMTFPLTIKGIETDPDLLGIIGKENPHAGVKCGDYVSIKPCSDNPQNLTYLGIYIGEIALSTMCRLDDSDGILHLMPAMKNPAIFVPALKRVVFGIESWWGTIDSADDLREITDEDIQNTGYVKAIMQKLTEELQAKELIK